MGLRKGSVGGLNPWLLWYLGVAWDNWVAGLARPVVEPVGVGRTKW